MSRASRKGYVGEAMVAAWFTARGYYVYRPRTTSRRRADTGDLRGLPFVVSVKNHARIQLAAAVDELTDLVGRANAATGILVHKRTGRGRAEEWYVTLPLRLMGPFVDAYMVVSPLAVEPSEQDQTEGEGQGDSYGEEHDGRRVTGEIPRHVNPPREATPHRVPRNHR